MKTRSQYLRCLRWLCSGILFGAILAKPLVLTGNARAFGAPATPTLRATAPEAKVAAPVGQGIAPWKPVDAPFQNDRNHRSAKNYAKVIDQFDVENNNRYRWDPDKTYCNIFAWDVTRAMGAEIPHWYDPQTGQATPGGKGLEMSASRMLTWLREHGKENGWRKASAQEAQQWANSGKPAIVIGNGGRNMGHVAVVRPGQITAKGPAIAQAGKRNIQDGHVYDGFYGGKEADFVEYWIHP